MNYRAIEVRWISYSRTFYEGQFCSNAYVDLKHKGQTVLFNNIKNYLFVCLNPNINKKYWLCLNCRNVEHTIERYGRTKVKSKMDCDKIVQFKDKPDDDMVLKELI